jgi:hypothetical protein
MSGLYEKEINEFKKVSIRYDNSSRTYYCFYHRTDNSIFDLTLSYDLNVRKWIVETYEYKHLFETNFMKIKSHLKNKFDMLLIILIHISVS